MKSMYGYPPKKKTFKWLRAALREYERLATYKHTDDMHNDLMRIGSIIQSHIDGIEGENQTRVNELLLKSVPLDPEKYN